MTSFSFNKTNFRQIKKTFLIFFFLLILVLIKNIRNIQDYNPTVIIKNHSWIFQKNEDIPTNNKVFAEFKAKNDNLGIVSIKFSTDNKVNNNYLQFKIREKGKNDWYYSNKYNVDQFQNYQYFPFGFPEISDSKGKTYQIEIDLPKEKIKDSIQIITNNPFLSKYSFPKKYLLQNKYKIIPFIFNKITSYFTNINSFKYLLIFIILLIYLKTDKARKQFFQKIKLFLAKIKRLNFKNISNLNLIISYITAGFFSVILFFLKNEKILKLFKPISENQNLILFATSIIIFCFTFIITLFFTNTPHFKVFIKKSAIQIAITLISFFILYRIQNNLSKMLGYYSFNSLPRKIFIKITFLVYILFFVFRKKILTIKFNVKNIYWFLLAAIAITAVSLSFYTPNGLLYGWDYSAYYNSIYVHAQGIPYSEKFTSGYGHYAILLRPIFKLIGLNLNTISIVTCIIGFIFITAIIYSMYKFIKHPFLRIIGLITIVFPFIGLLRGAYPQTYPHRFLFPSIITAIAALLIKNKKINQKIIIIIGYFISMLGIIWNSDTGLICLLSWEVLHTYILFSIKNKKKNFLLKITIPITLALISFFLSWQITNIYNTLIGGKPLNLYYFMFPILENSYMNEVLRTEIPLYFTPWMPILLIFYFFLSLGIFPFIKRKNKINKINKINNTNNTTVFTLFISILGIGQMAYFINRCAYLNILTCYYQLLLLLLISAEYTLQIIFKNKKTLLDKILTGIFYSIMSILLLFSSTMFVNIIPKINSSKEYYDIKDIKKITTYFKNNFPKDTPIISVDTALLSTDLGWKNSLGLTDLPNLFPEKNIEIFVEILTQYNKPFIIEKKYYDAFKNFEYTSLNQKNEDIKKITEIYDAKELTQMNKQGITQSIFLYLTPKL